ncbi:hypothetical protein BA011_30185 (plasmid) [Rhizobium leguminosarum]|uniref:Solute-binding protein family 5 domain-containing protein n=1 Tax=Rhizobium leguminosarum TaxID=384 RepID=A0A1B1CJL9_RHILE|nr:hypothetical protein BA011_30185 [Rhizobium leguminosarum]
MAKETKGVTVAKQDDIGVAQQIRLNTIQPPFNNVKLREALLYAVNGDDFLAAVISDPSLGKACKSFYTCSSPYGSGFPFGSGKGQKWSPKAVTTAPLRSYSMRPKIPTSMRS